MPGTFSLIAGGCLLASASDLPDSSKFRPELMSHGRCCLRCLILVAFSEVNLLSSNRIMFVQEIDIHRSACTRMFVCIHLL